MKKIITASMLALASAAIAAPAHAATNAAPLSHPSERPTAEQPDTEVSGDLAKLVQSVLPSELAGIAQHLSGPGLTSHGEHDIFDDPDLHGRS